MSILSSQGDSVFSTVLINWERITYITTQHDRGNHFERFDYNISKIRLIVIRPYNWDLSCFRVVVIFHNVFFQQKLSYSYDIWDIQPNFQRPCKSIHEDILHKYISPMWASLNTLSNLFGVVSLFCEHFGEAVFQILSWQGTICSFWNINLDLVLFAPTFCQKL